MVLVVYTSSKATALKQAERMTTVSDSIQNKPANNGDANNGDFDKADLVPCRDDPYVSFEIGSMKFKVLRSATLSWVDESRVSHPPGSNSSHPYKNCEIKDLGKIIAIGGVSFGLEEYSADKINELKTTYRLRKNLIESAEKEGNIETLTSGIKKIHWGGDTYIFPEKDASTGNGEPLVLDCSNGKIPGKFVAEGCGTKYVNSDGLIFSYSFYRWKHPESEYLTLDKHYREIYEKAKVLNTSIKKEPPYIVHDSPMYAK